MTAIDTNAATVEKVVKQLSAWGWTAELYSGWRSRHNRQATLVWESVTVHHTGAGPVSTSYMVNPTDRAALVVLCNAHVTKDHHIRIIAAGGASHAGMSDRANYARMRAGNAPLAGTMKPGPDSSTFSANRLSFGIEVDNNRATPEWDEWMQGATVALCAALHVASGWKVSNAPRVITHKELTRRKPGDPILDAGRLRSLVKVFLAAPYGPPGSKPYELGDRLLSKDGNDSGTDVSTLIAALNGKGYKLTNDGLFGPAVDAAVRDVQAKAGLAVDGIVGPATLAVLTADPEPTPEPVPVPNPEPTPKPSGVPVRVATLNCLDPNIRQGTPAQLHPLTEARRDALVAVTRKAKADFYCLTECPKETSDVIRSGLPGGPKRWKVWERGAQRIVFDSSRCTHSEAAGTGWGYHGAVVATFTVDGQQVTIGSYHLPPDSTTATSKQQGLLSDWLGEVAKMPGEKIIGGDGMNSTDWAEGWTDARKAAKASSTRDKPTYRTAITDRILSLGNVVWRGYNVHNAGVGSDHNLVVTAATVGGDLP